MGCSLFLHRLEDASHVEFRQWGGASGATVRLYTVHGGGHTIPGGTGYYPAFIVGRTNQDIVIAEEVMHFFSIAR
jgi:polyhydroxybutyrate depolymerase